MTRILNECRDALKMHRNSLKQLEQSITANKEKRRKVSKDKHPELYAELTYEIHKDTALQKTITGFVKTLETIEIWAE